MIITGISPWNRRKAGVPGFWSSYPWWSKQDGYSRAKLEIRNSKFETIKQCPKFK
jgi:hypothetical protein